jgi:hypothetical protein
VGGWTALRPAIRISHGNHALAAELSALDLTQDRLNLKRAFLVLALLVGCSTHEVRAPLGLKGPLRVLLDSVPLALDHCVESHRQYNLPFWRAPYRDCRDSLTDGSQGFEVDADSVVVSTHRSWVVLAFEQQPAWNREAARLTRLFGTPVRSFDHPFEDLPLSGDQGLRIPRCAAWRGSDSVEVSLYLDPMTDVGPPRVDQPWRLRRYGRHGPLLGAVSCGLRP